jgi:dihydropteroate synthase
MTDATVRASAAPRRVLFVTGRLAEPALRRVLTNTALPFAYEVAVLKITVAALMTTPWIARNLDLPDGTDLVMIPGLCEGDPQVIVDKVGVRVEKGPRDLRELPVHFGRPAASAAYGAWDIEIVAEINNAPRMTRHEIQKTADYFHESGADIIDIGCTPGLAFPALADVVRECKGGGRRVSVDTFDSHEILTAVEAGAELVLSVNGSNVDVVSALAGTGARVVAVPDLGGGLETLEPTLEALARHGVPYLIDPVLEPIGHGFTASIARYAETRRRHPEAEMLMGIGNLTELTAADSTGVHAVLVAICQELGIRAVLTTEVIPWARGAVKEVDVARRLMHYAVTQRTIPKGVDNRLVTIKDPAVLEYSEDELRALQQGITDPNFRIFADRDGITVLNNERYVHSAEVGRLDSLFARLGVDEATHAFYLGTELAKAGLAVTLGKNYRQDAPLSWGYLTPPDDQRPGHTRLTGRPSRPHRPPPGARED